MTSSDEYITIFENHGFVKESANLFEYKGVVPALKGSEIEFTPNVRLIFYFPDDLGSSLLETCLELLRNKVPLEDGEYESMQDAFGEVDYRDITSGLILRGAVHHTGKGLMEILFIEKGIINLDIWMSHDYPSPFSVLTHLDSRQNKMTPEKLDHYLSHLEQSLWGIDRVIFTAFEEYARISHEYLNQVRKFIEK